MYNLTLVQYENGVRAATLADYPELTGVEYDSCYPRGCRMQEWIDAIWGAARNGEQIAPRVLDDLFARQERVARSLYHDYRDTAFPAGYLWPDVRKQEPAFKRPKPLHRYPACSKCGKHGRSVTNTGTQDYPVLLCGTCQHREARRINTREMWCHGRRGY